MRNIHVRDVPDATHEVLNARAESHGMSLSRYVLRVLERHCELPTINEWLEELEGLEPAEPGVRGVEAVRAARNEDDDRLRRGSRR